MGAATPDLGNQLTFASSAQPRRETRGSRSESDILGTSGGATATAVVFVSAWYPLICYSALGKDPVSNDIF